MLFRSEKRAKAELAVESMRNVSRQTLDEDANEGVKTTMKKLQVSKTVLPVEIADDNDIMQYVIKGSDEQWCKALEKNELDVSGSVKISSVRDMKRKLNEQDIEKESMAQTAKPTRSSKKSKKISSKNSPKHSKKGSKQ